MPVIEREHVFCLWAACERYRHPNLVAAFSGSLREAMPEEFDARVTEAKDWFLDFDDGESGEWTFWTTTASVDRPEVPVFYTGPNQHPQDGALMHCEFCRLCRACGKRLRWSFLRGRLWVGHAFACECRGERTDRAR